ncbi:MAG: hypothetical protein JWQ29_1062 [Phenylobacterium sp.]|nr:hypothetical protein [Phenylobacterium sp.]
MDVTRQRAHRAWRSAERIKRLSDKLVSVGPVGLGLDGVLAWIPGANLLYSVGAGGLLIYEAVGAGAEGWTIARMAGYLIADSAMSEVPILGWAMDTLFPGHLMAARALQKDIEARHGPAELPANWGRWAAAGRPAP